MVKCSNNNSLKMKLILFALIYTALARGEETGEGIAKMIKYEILLLPILSIFFVLMYINYDEIKLALKLSRASPAPCIELKPLVHMTEPEMEP
jgi:hypothetical protein